MTWNKYMGDLIPIWWRHRHTLSHYSNEVILLMSHFARTMSSQTAFRTPSARDLRPTSTSRAWLACRYFHFPMQDGMKMGAEVTAANPISPKKIIHTRATIERSKRSNNGYRLTHANSTVSSKTCFHQSRADMEISFGKPHT